MNHEPHSIRRPPLGVLPFPLWHEDHPDPDLSDLLERYIDVSQAIARYRAAGVKPQTCWLYECGLLYLRRADPPHSEGGV